MRRTVINIQGNYNLTRMTLSLFVKLNCTDVNDQFLNKKIKYKLSCLGTGGIITNIDMYT